MEVSNRFDLLVSLAVNDESIESNSNDNNLLKQEHKQQSTRNFWEVPEYVEKSIPCLLPKEEIIKSVTKVKPSSRPVKKMQPIIDESKDEQVIISATAVEERIQPTTIYPPQPYKFKQTAANHRNESIPKFNRKNNALPKHTSTRGNSKSCTHQI